MSIYKPKLSPHHHYDFQVLGLRFCGTTGTGDRRKAEAIERAEREKRGRTQKRLGRTPHFLRGHHALLARGWTARRDPR